MIHVENLTKSFVISKRKAGTKEAIKSFFFREKEQIKALEHVNFDVAKGEIVGYIGPNGAGKSTTIKILSGILRPDSGVCQVNGLVPWNDRIAHTSNIGVVFGQRSQLWWDIPVIDSFYLLKEIYGLSDKVFSNSLEELTQLIDINSLMNIPTRQLSLGQRMRCEIVASLLHQPDILFLDEPTIGLDAVSKVAVRGFIKELNRTKKTTVILTTHDMQDIEKLANRIILIGKGQKLFDGSFTAFQDMRKNEEETLDDLLIALYQQYGL